MKRGYTAGGRNHAFIGNDDVYPACIGLCEPLVRHFHAAVDCSFGCGVRRSKTQLQIG